MRIEVVLTDHKKKHLVLSIEKFELFATCISIGKLCKPFKPNKLHVVTLT